MQWSKGYLWVRSRLGLTRIGNPPKRLFTLGIWKIGLPGEVFSKNGAKPFQDSPRKLGYSPVLR